MAKGAAKRGKRIAFGNRQQIIWDHNSEAIFLGNPNVAKPGSENDLDVEWIEYYRGNRIYNWHDRDHDRWHWHFGFRPTPGEVFLLAEERRFADSFGTGFVLVEPNVPTWKASAVNKQWPRQNWVQLVERLRKDGHRVIEIGDGLKAPDFRHALAVMERAALYIGPEGGLHHGAAAVGTKAVVLFGAWIPPQVTGYDSHINIATGKACGSLKACPHCAEAMASISVDQVFEAARSQL
jgi:hypothetical protein